MMCITDCMQADAAANWQEEGYSEVLAGLGGTRMACVHVLTGRDQIVWQRVHSCYGEQGGGGHTCSHQGETVANMR